ncbi:MAG: hypothetical protein HQL72_09200 [Magnetococcales bacterium]|nr:hypothetical protein [Magnetococcales bacterium]
MKADSSTTTTDPESWKVHRATLADGTRFDLKAEDRESLMKVGLDADFTEV